MFFSGQQFGNYTLVRLLGSGCFGEVWLANRQTKFVTTKVAIKLPLREQVDAETIKQEATVWEQASGHPNVLPLIEADEHDGQILIVSEYAADGTLEDLLDKEGILPLKKAVEMAIGIAQGLEFLHSRQIIHRDIKPANILLQGDIPRLTDFGLSRAVSGNSMSISMSLNGTPYYMSPEAFNRKRNKQTDIWSFGVVLFKMLAGYLPFEGNDVAELYTTIFTRPPAPLPAYVPPFLQQIVFKAIAKSPGERYGDAGEIRADLMRCLAALSAEGLRLHQTDESFTRPTGEASPVASQTIANPKLINTKDSQNLTQNSAGFAKNSENSDNFKSSSGSADFAKNSGRAGRSLRPLSVSSTKPQRRFFSLKYAAALCILLVTVFAAGFYVVSSRSPIPYRKGDKFGFSTWGKQLVIGTKYDRAFPFSGNRALVAVGQKNADGGFTGKYGFIDKSGREVIALEYDFAESYYGELARVGKLDPATKKMLYGFIDLTGTPVIPVKYEDAQRFSDNLAPVKTDGKWGVINRQGQFVIQPEYDWIDEFSGDLAAIKKGNKFGFINGSGSEALPAVYDSAGRFSDEKAPVEKDGKAFFIDTGGNEAIPYKYNSADSFSEGFALVKQNGKAGFITKNGIEAITFRYENDRGRFSEGLAAVELNGKTGFINKAGTIVVPFKYSSAEPMQNNIALVTGPDGKEFYIGYNGTEFYEP